MIFARFFLAIFAKRPLVFAWVLSTLDLWYPGLGLGSEVYSATVPVKIAINLKWGNTCDISYQS